VGDRDELLVRAGLMTAPSDQKAADPSAEIARLRAENADLRAKLAEANAEIERLRNKVARMKLKFPVFDKKEIAQLRIAIHPDGKPDNLKPMFEAATKLLNDRVDRLVIKAAN